MPEFIGMPRRAGKTFYAIRRALELGGAIAVTRESTRQRILETAAFLDIQPPEIIIIGKEKATAIPAVALIEYDL